MGIVAVLDPDVVVNVQGGAVRLMKGNHVVRVLQLHEVSELQVHGNATVTPGARRVLLREGIDVAFFGGDGAYLGRLVGPESRAGERRLAQLRHALDPARVLAFARAVVKGKVENQRRVLLRRQRRVQVEAIADVLATLRGLGPAIDEAADVDAVRGLEGYAARAYFEGFGHALQNPNFTFAGRNRRPPRDPPNAALSFGYALLVSEIEGAVRSAGLEPYVGCLHVAARGAPSLALDLAEEFRPVVDDVVLTLFNRRQLAPEDFREPPPEELGAEAEVGVDAVYLGRVGREIALRAWAQQLERRFEHPQTGQQWRLRDLFAEQAAQAARVFEDRQPAYQPFRLGD